MTMQPQLLQRGLSDISRSDVMSEYKDMEENSQQTQNSDANIEATNEQEEQQTIEIYKRALTFNVIAKYDPFIKQLLHISSYCVVYEYDTAEEDWKKSSFQGPLTIYSRNVSHRLNHWDNEKEEGEISKVNMESELSTELKNSFDNGKGSGEVEVDEFLKVSVDEILASNIGEFFKFGLIVLNRIQTDNFSIGLLGDKYLKSNDLNNDKGLVVEKAGDLVIVRDFESKAFGLWLFDEADREILYKLLKYCIEN